MSLTVGRAPFSKVRKGQFNFEIDAPEHILYWESSAKKVRAVVNNKTLVESRDIKLLHETGHLPIYYFPLADVRGKYLEKTNHHTDCPFKGTASYYSIATEDEERENAAWTYPDPPEGCPPIEDHVAFYWDAVDEWWEEAERIFVHARDPYHHLDTIDTDRHIVVEVSGEKIAESTHATMLFETGLPPRFYIPEIDVNTRYLISSDTVTRCPYKGTTTRYYTISAGEEMVEDGVWVYDQPLDGVSKIAGKLAFYNKKVDLTVDGESW